MESTVIRLARREASWLARAVAGPVRAFTWVVAAIAGPDLDGLKITDLDLDHDYLWTDWR